MHELPDRGQRMAEDSAQNSAATRPEDLSLSRLGLQFRERGVERNFRRWRSRSSLPLIRLGILTGLLSAVFVPLAIYRWSPERAWAFFVGCYGVLVPAFVVGLLLLLIDRVKTFVFPLTAFLNFLPGSAFVWMSFYALDEPTVAVAAAIVAAFYAPILRLPVLWATLAVTPYMVGANLGLLQEHLAGNARLLAVVGHTVALSITLLTVIVVCLVIGYLNRVAYRNEQIIGQQQKKLEHSHGLIRRYVPPSVAEHILSGRESLIDAPRRQRTTILFCDVCHFTQIADRVEPEIVTQVLSEYLSAMANLIDEHRGTLNEFAGDGLMALFGAPQFMEPAEQARQAIAAAQAMQAGMPALNDSWRRLGLGTALEIRIGINTGMVSVGSYGSQGRMTYTAIGLQTNIASRIESRAQAGQILISDATWQLIRDELRCEPRGEIECKGVHYPIQVYSPTSGGPPKPSI